MSATVPILFLTHRPCRGEPSASWLDRCGSAQPAPHIPR